MAGKQGVYSIEVEPAQLKNLIQTLNKLDKETQNVVRDKAMGLSQRLAGQLMMFSHSAPAPQTKLVAQTIALLWGTEYGSGPGVDSIGRAYTGRFKAPRNKRGYWIAPAVDYYTPIVAKEYISMIQGVIKDLRLD
jgi:hypothetical protein